MKISIIIVSYNNEKWVNSCLVSLQKQTHKNFEIIWVDNNSQDKTREIVKNPEFEDLHVRLVVTEKNLGFAGGNNRGLELVTGDIIFLLNSDTEIQEDVLDKAVLFFKTHPFAGIMQNRTMLMKDTNKFDSIGSLITFTGFLKHIDPKTKDPQEEFKVFSGKGASLFIKREVLSKTYLFEDVFESYFEDSDLCARAWLAGFEVWYSPFGTTLHAGGSTALLLQSGRTDFHSFKNRLFTLLTIFELQTLTTMIPIHIMVCLFVAGMYALRGKFTKSWAVFRAMAWNIVNIPFMLKRRNKIQSKRVLTDHELFAITKDSFSLKYALKAIFGYTSF